MALTSVMSASSDSLRAAETGARSDGRRARPRTLPSSCAVRARKSSRLPLPSAVLTVLSFFSVSSLKPAGGGQQAVGEARRDEDASVSVGARVEHEHQHQHQQKAKA